ncbi:hypothetical protein AKJ16_DCAP04376 [Drosera capensis]
MPCSLPHILSFQKRSIQLRTMQALISPLSLHHFPPNPRLHVTLPSLLRALSSSTSAAGVSESGDQRLNYSGVRLEETVVETKSGKVRLDAWISSRILGISRARVQASIRAGLVAVNGRVVDKVSHVVRIGDLVKCTISELQPLRADPEEIPLDIVYEDDHVLVVNKPAHMVVHPAPGNPRGTLVNAILNHCSLPTVAFYNNEAASEAEDALDDDNIDDEFKIFPAHQMPTEGTTFGPSIRPGIVHRLDKGTSGLLVVAKDELSHAHLSQQFKKHSVSRVYLSLTSGVPSPAAGRVEIPIGRDVNNRLRMTAVTGPNRSRNVRHAASRYKVVEVLANGGSALVEWRLETGRTHQAIHFLLQFIRAHAKYMGIPLLGDEVYGGTKDMSLSLLRPKTQSSSHAQLGELVSGIERQCLHAMILGAGVLKFSSAGLSIHILVTTCTSLALRQLISLKCCVSFVQFKKSWWLNTELYASEMVRVERGTTGYKVIFTSLIEHIEVVH